MTTCHYCSGPLEHLGNLGNLQHYRCKNCGMMDAKHDETFGGHKKKEEVKPKEPQEPAAPKIPSADVKSVGTPKKKE